MLVIIDKLYTQRTLWGVLTVRCERNEGILGSLDKLGIYAEFTFTFVNMVKDGSNP